MSITPERLRQDADVKSAIRQMIQDGKDQAEIIPLICADYKLSESTARRRYREIKPHVSVSEATQELWEEAKSQQSSRIVNDIKRLDMIINTCIQNGNYKVIASLQSQKTALYKVHATAHPEILWDFGSTGS